jgi:hypothetical protein
VNVYNAKVVSQDGNIFNISFDVKNGGVPQAGLKYNISLLKETASGKFLSDKYIYPETLSLNANTTLNKSIVYTAPSTLTGDYSLLVTVENSSGIPLGLGIAGKVKLVSTVNTVEILPDTCYLSVVGEKGNIKYSLTQGVDIEKSESLSLTCTAVNPSKVTISAVPTYETHYRTLSGDTVAQEGGDVTSISFNAGEKKTISLNLPKSTKPQAYDIKVALSSNGILSNSVVVHYVLHGVSATIQNLSLDKDYYNNKDIAKISFLWFSSADNFPGSRLVATSQSEITLVAKITNDKQKNCVNPINQILSKTNLVELSVPVIANCNNPQVSIELKDTNGNTLDQKNFSFLSTSQPVSKSTIPTILIVILGVLIVAGFAFYFINLKKKDHAERDLTKSNETN